MLPFPDAWGSGDGLGTNSTLERFSFVLFAEGATLSDARYETDVGRTTPDSFLISMDVATLDTQALIRKYEVRLSSPFRITNKSFILVVYNIQNSRQSVRPVQNHQTSILKGEHKKKRPADKKTVPVLYAKPFLSVLLQLPALRNAKTKILWRTQGQDGKRRRERSRDTQDLVASPPHLLNLLDRLPS